MKKTVLEIYALAVCFVTVVCFVVSLGIGLYSLVEIYKPDFTMDSWEYGKYQTNDVYWNEIGKNRYCGDESKKNVRPGETELTAQRQEAFASALANESRGGAQTLAKALIVILIDIVVFFIHWTIARRARASTAS